MIPQRNYKAEQQAEIEDRKKRILGRMRRQYIHPGRDRQGDKKPDRQGDGHDGTEPVPAR